MKQKLFVGSIGALLAVALAGPFASSGEVAKRPAIAASKKAARQTAKAYFENISKGKAGDNLRLFVREDVAVMGISGGAGAEKIWQKKASEIIKYWQDVGALTHTVDAVRADLLDGALAAVSVNYYTDAVKCRAVFTLTSEGGGWRIASLVFETRLP